MARAGKTAWFEFLGTGTSTGVPVAGCDCRVCRSPDPHDNRMRSSALIRRGGRDAIIDTGPEFRVQCLRAKVKYLDAVLLTHDHADHLHGFDDIRAYSYFRHRTMPVWGAERVLDTIRSRFDYIWKPFQKGGGVPDVKLRTITGEFEVLGLRVTPIPVMHGKLPILGYRVGDLAYLTDISSLPDESLPLLRDLGTLVICCVRRRPHETHLNAAGARRLHRLIRPRQTLLTHLTHRFTHRELIAEFDADIGPAYDGMRVEIDVSRG